MSRLAKLRREAVPLLIVAIAVLAARSTFADHYVVPSRSMEHTLYPGDRVFVDKTAYGFRVPFTSWVVIPRDEPAAGDIAIFNAPDDGVRLIKRIVAVGGDEIELRHGHLYRNGEPAGDAADSADAVEWLGGQKVAINLADGGGPDYERRRIPDGQVLAIGDYRGNSRDSRAFGLVPANSLYARAVAIYWRSADGLSWKLLH